MDLTALDYEILEFVSQFDSVEKSKIVDHFSPKVESIEYRIKLLSQQQYNFSIGPRIAIKNSSYILESNVISKDNDGSRRSTSFFSITAKGRVALQDHKIKIQSEINKNRKDTILRIVPIAISLIALLKSFWPELTSKWQQLTQLLK